MWPWVRQNFLHMTPKAQTIKETKGQIGKFDFKVHSKGHYQKSEMTTQRWEKIFANHVPYKGRVSGIDTELI